MDIYIVENKLLDIKIIFETYLKHIENKLKTFSVLSRVLQKKHRIVIKNWLLELFLKMVTK